MEFNENKNFNENNQMQEVTVILKEKNGNSNSFWYLIVAILILGLLGWYGYTAGWFSKKTTTTTTTVKEEKTNAKTFPFEDNNEIKAPIDNVTIQTSDSFPVKKTLVLKGQLSGCTYLNEPQIMREGNTFYVNLTTRKDSNSPCSEDVPSPYERQIELEVVGLPAGVYNVVVNEKQTTFELEQDNSVDFSVGGEK